MLSHANVVPSLRFRSIDYTDKKRWFKNTSWYANVTQNHIFFNTLTSRTVKTAVRLYSQRLHSSCLILKVYKQKYILWTTCLSQATKVFMFGALCASIFWFALCYTEIIKVMGNIWYSSFSVKCRNSKNSACWG